MEECKLVYIRLIRRPARVAWWYVPSPVHSRVTAGPPETTTTKNVVESLKENRKRRRIKSVWFSASSGVYKLVSFLEEGERASHFPVHSLSLMFWMIGWIRTSTDCHWEFSGFYLAFWCVRQEENSVDNTLWHGHFYYQLTSLRPLSGLWVRPSISIRSR